METLPTIFQRMRDARALAPDAAELPHNALTVLIAHLFERIETAWHTSPAEREQIAWIPSALAALTCTSRDARDAIAGEAA